MPDLETPEGDAVEQQQTVDDPDEVSVDEVEGPDTSVPEADEGDLVESSLEVPLDEDDWR